MPCVRYTNLCPLTWTLTLNAPQGVQEGDIHRVERDARQSTASALHSKAHLEFDIQLPDRKFFLQAQDQRDADTWYDKIMQAIVSFREETWR